MHIDGLHHSQARRVPSTAPSPHPIEKPAPTRQVAVRSLDGPSRPAGTSTASHHRPVEASHLHQRRVASSPVRPSVASLSKTKLHVSKPLSHPKAASKPKSRPAVVHGAAEIKARAERASRIARSSHIRKFVATPSAPTLATPPPALEKEGAGVSSHTPAPKIENTHHRPPALSQYQLSTESHHGHKDSHGRSRKIIGHKARLASLSALGLSVLLIGGYIAYLNAPNLAVRIAASRSGVDARLPGYSPDGYRYAGPINYGPGSVVVNFRGENGQNYSLAQEKSDWDSRSLLENVVAREDSDYQAYQEKGLTIYIYNGSDAAWVNGGIRYTLDSTAALQPEQLLKLAASL